MPPNSSSRPAQPEATATGWNARLSAADLFDGSDRSLFGDEPYAKPGVWSVRRRPAAGWPVFQLPYAVTVNLPKIWKMLSTS